MSFMTVSKLMELVEAECLDMVDVFQIMQKTRTSKQLSKKLVELGYEMNDQTPTKEDLALWHCWVEKQDIQGWEGWFLPENKLYPKVLEQIDPTDVIFDVGAGNLALDVLLAERAQKVYAVEVNPIVIVNGLKEIGYDLPRNLIPICGNALDIPLPSDVNTLVMLLRNFVHKLPAAWCQLPKLILNLQGKFEVLRID